MGEQQRALEQQNCDTLYVKECIYRLENERKKDNKE
jgi:hypothetical protein